MDVAQTIRALVDAARHAVTFLLACVLLVIDRNGRSRGVIVFVYVLCI